MKDGPPTRGSELARNSFAHGISPASSLPQRRGNQAFTLIELLVVVGLIAALSWTLAGGLPRGNRAAALESGQRTLADVLALARTRAAASGCRARVLVNAEAGNGEEFRRRLLVQREQTLGSNTWSDPVLEVTLPAGVYLLPYRSRTPAGFFADPAAWTRFASTEPLDSSALYGAPLTLSVEGGTTESWDVVQFTPAGTLSFGMGDLVLASGRRRAPAAIAAGESPVEAIDPGAVRGVSLSLYGLPVLIDGREGF